MVGGLTLLLLFQLAGELIATGLDLPIPGPVIGMGLLFVVLIARRWESESPARSGAGLERAAQALLNHLSLLFIPAGCGIITHLALIRQEWLPITVSLVGSTLVAIAVTALTMQALLRIQSAAKERQPRGS